jgi:hypothetical protein
MKKSLWPLLVFVVVILLWTLWPRSQSLSPNRPFTKALTKGEAPAQVETPSETSASPQIPVPKTSPSSSQTQSSESTEASPMTREEFASLVEQALQELPRKETLRKLPAEEVEHQAPPQIFEAGRILGGVKEALDKNPDLVPQAVEFYAHCAESNNYPNSVRALCYSNGRVYADKAQLHFDPEVTDTVKHLAKQLPVTTR